MGGEGGPEGGVPPLLGGSREGGSVGSGIEGFGCPPGWGGLLALGTVYWQLGPTSGDGSPPVSGVWGGTPPKGGSRGVGGGVLGGSKRGVRGVKNGPKMTFSKTRQKLGSDSGDF